MVGNTMNQIQDPGILALYLLSREEYAAAATDTQKRAIEQLKKLSRSGNVEADAALHRLKHLPDLHPLLREIIAA
jgi:hypothetical protein